MASTSLSTLLDNPDQVSNAGKQAAVDTVDTLGNRLTELVTADMSDTQVNEILDSVIDAVDKMVTGVTPSHPMIKEDLEVQNSIKEFNLRRKYLTKSSLKHARKKLETADMNDEERAFFSTRAKLRWNYKNNQLKQMAREGIPKLQRTVDQVLSSASTFMVDGQQPLKLTAPNMACSVQRKSVRGILQEDIQRGNVRMRLRRKDSSTAEEVEAEIPEVATLKTTIFNRNPFTWENEQTVARITSPTVMVNLSTDEPFDDPSNMQVMTYDMSLPNPSPVKGTTVSPRYLPLDADQMLYHRLELKSTSDALLLSLKPSQVPLVYDVYFRSGEFPTSKEHHYHTVVRFEENVTKVATCPPGLLPSAGTVFFGLKPTPLDHPRLRRDLSPNVSGQGQLNSGSSEGFSQIKYGDYEIGVAATGCSQWMDQGVKWDSDVCKIENMPSLDQTSCACDLPLSSIFTIATTFYLPVNMVDFSTVFTEIDLLDNASVFTVVILMLSVYILLVVWARRKDKTDIIKWGVTALADNAPGHNHLYLITVYTGMRMSAGTKSKVGFVIAGEKGDTGVRPLNDGIRNGFPKQSVRHYLMTVESCLGDLQYLRIWHDNSGKGPLASWFLHKVVVEDLQEDKKYIFKCDDWLGVDESDGFIERLLPVSSKENLLSFSSLFYNNARKNVTDSHIWFSVLFRPQRSHFTRVQRLSCCACLLFLSMICNALFYQGGDNIVQPTTIKLGFLRFSVHQVYTSFITISIVTPVELALIWLFKKSKPHLEDTLEVVRANGGCHSCFISKEKVQMANALLSKGFLKPKGALLPHFCVYIAWTIVLICISTSAFFVFLLSQQWGRAKSEEWLTSFLLTFFESLIILDPLKVIVMAVFFAMFVHKLEEDSNDLNKDEIRSNCGAAINNQLAENTESPVKPLEAEEVEKARTMRLRETKTFEVVKEIGLYLLFLVIMCSIGYTNRDPRSFSLNRNLQNMLVNSQQDGRLGLKDVTTVEQYFSWLNKTAFPALFHELYDNQSRRTWGDRFFIRDLQNVRVGPPRLRQVRTVHASVCAVRGIALKVCDTFSASSREEDSDYCIGWKSGPCAQEERAFKLTSKAWKYTSSSEVWGIPVSGVYNSYSGGGYIAELNINLDVSKAVLQELLSAFWVDKRTRLLTLDFTVYNANTNLFCFASLMSEFPGTGGTITTAVILPFRVYQYAGTLGNFVFFTEIMFIFLLAVAVVKLVLKMVKHGVKYLYDFWHVVDFVSLVSCFVAVAMYGLRKFSTEMALHRFQLDGRQFVSFQQVTFWDNMMVAMVGLVTFTCTIRTVKILGFSRRLDAILTVLSMALRDLFYFSLMFLIFLMAFVACGYFMFGQDLKAYQTVLTTPP
ncbi:polycystin-1-like protein 2 [Liolophura sinensis]|uniref:polycystin-1-like protein 2 n=1 Tax=Liolophura sinensis TaxID=3198878 RepID=UPI0031598F24